MNFEVKVVDGKINQPPPVNLALTTLLTVEKIPTYC